MIHSKSEFNVDFKSVRIFDTPILLELGAFECIPLHKPAFSHPFSD